jgi:hypothetical protein
MTFEPLLLLILRLVNFCTNLQFQYERLSSKNGLLQMNNPYTSTIAPNQIENLNQNTMIIALILCLS